MFREIGQIASLMKQLPHLTDLMQQLPKIQAEMQALNQRLGQLSAEGDAGGGMVKVRVNGKMEMVGCTITDEALTDRELLEDMIRAANNQAVEKMRVMVAEETSKLAGSLGLPPGMLPGAGGPTEAR
jgi:hypothetical protein